MSDARTKVVGERPARPASTPDSPPTVTRSATLEAADADAEIVALGVVVKKLGPLSPAARERVLAYLLALFDPPALRGAASLRTDRLDGEAEAVRWPDEPDAPTQLGVVIP